ncbi:M15 family metallopeptidase [Mariniluteicoccus flavus]
MKLRSKFIVLAGATAIGVVGGAAGSAVAAPKSAYPKPVHQYVTHPQGFNDAAEVRIVGGQVKCNVKLATVNHDGVKATVREDLAPLVKELFRITEEKYGYQLKKESTGGYNCRFVRGSTTSISNHSYGRAVDMNWNDNPMSSSFKSDIPPAVVKLWMEHGFYWGGHYKSRPDTMHFEYVAPRGKIDTYVASAKKIGKPEPTKPPTTTKPATTKPATPKPATTKPATTKPATTKPATTKPATTKPATTKPATTKPATTKPATTKPATTKPATTKPATTKPATTKPATTKPAPTKPSTVEPPKPTVTPEPTRPPGTPVETTQPTIPAPTTEAPVPVDPAPTTEVPADPAPVDPAPTTEAPAPVDPPVDPAPEVPAGPAGDTTPGHDEHDHAADPHAADPATEGGLANTGADDDLTFPALGGLAGLALGSALLFRRRS